MHINYQRSENRSMVWQKEHLFSTTPFISKSDSFKWTRKHLQRKFRAQVKNKLRSAALNEAIYENLPRWRKEIWWDM